eukprot:1150812-Pelagomonas_calceolata.AAC.2
MLMGIWRVTGSNRLQNLAVSVIIISNSTPIGNRLARGMLNIAGPTNTQKDGVESHNSCTYEFAEVCRLPNLQF